MLESKHIRGFNSKRKLSPRGLLCHAPRQSIYFAQNGDILACCYNRKHVLGRYPESNVWESWTGEKAQELRKEITNKQLGPGCDLCLKQLQAGNYTGLHAAQYDPYADNPYYRFMHKLRERFLKKPTITLPKVLEFELSNICNLECVMCTGEFSSSIRKNRENKEALESPYDEDFVEQIVPFMPFLEDAKFLGAEPFLVPIYYEIWDLMMQINPKIRMHITTNGTILNERVKELMEGLDTYLILSIDSLKKETYESIRVNANFDRVMENMQWFKENAKEKGRVMSLAVCPMQQNWEEIPDMIRFCNEQGFHIYFNTLIFPWEMSLGSLEKLALEEVIQFYEKADLPEGRFTQRFNKKMLKDLVLQLKYWLKHGRA